MSKKEEKKRTFESESLALPPLKMVLSEAGGLYRPAREKAKSSQEAVDGAMREEVVLRLIERLIRKE